MKKTLPLVALLSLSTTATWAQEAPAPRRMPRTPVAREVLAHPKENLPASREVQGLAAITDGEKLKVGNVDLRLFGVVPPQLAASFGPQARAQLDMLAAGQNVTCKIRDRDRDGRFLATCNNYNGTDMALDLLRHGLAVTARGSIASTELAAPYASAEQAAQNQKLGLWAVAVAPAATGQAGALAPPPPAPALQPAILDTAPPAGKDDKNAALEAAAEALQPPPAADVFLQAQTRPAASAVETASNASFFERYQILIAGGLMLATTLSIIGAIMAQKTRDKREERRSVAAALRGELMAARGVCLGRLKSIAADADDRLTVWPRIRATLYQAYVGRLGLLGAELARQIASIYGQASDYAALYTQNSGATHEVSKKQALEILAKRIEEVLPKLNDIERSGVAPTTQLMPPTRPRLPAVAPRAAIPAVPAPPVVTPEEPAALAAPVSTPYNTGASDINPTALNAYTGTHASAPPPSRFRAALEWMEESARQFVQSRCEPQPPSGHIQLDPHVAEYAALIEADMARYQQYGEQMEPLDIAPPKRRQA